MWLGMDLLIQLVVWYLIGSSVGGGRGRAVVSND